MNTETEEIISIKTVIFLFKKYKSVWKSPIL